MTNPLPPIIKNRYELQQQLGRGAMGVVYRATDRLTGQMVALKQVLYDEFERADAADALEFILAHEFQMLASIRHPNIISVLDYGFYGKQPYFTMNFLENPVRFDFAAEQLDLNGKIDLLLQLLQAVAYLHRRQVLHRDLKPANVLVDPQGQVRVLDFGLAAELNQRAMIAGTPAYMAPEIFDGVGPSRASDLFAVGVMAYTIFTSAYPFPASEGSSIIEAIQEQEPDYADFPVLASEISPLSLRDVVCRLLAKSPADRYTYAESVIEDLCVVLGQEIPKENAAIRESFLQAARFIGRRQELAQLEDAMFSAMSGRGSMWLLGGESGIGKSRLLQELRTRALVQNIQVLQVTGLADKPRSMKASMQAWQQAVRELLIASRMILSESDTASLQTLIPDLDRLLSVEIGATPPASHQDQVQTIANLIHHSKQTLLLIVEDAHWLEAGLAPIQQLLPAIEKLPILLVMSYRSDEYPDFPTNFPTAQQIQLKRLGDHEIAELSASMIGDTARKPEVLDLLQRETDGNAFFLVEVVRALAEEAGNLQKVGIETLPSVVFEGNLQRLIERRFQQLPQWAFGGLQVAAVIGRDLDLRLLDHILMPFLALVSGTDISVTISSIWRGDRGVTLDDWLLVCADAAILEVADNRWRFAHDKFREYLLANLTEPQQKMLSSQVAKAVEAVYPITAPIAAWLAELWQQAGQPQRAERYVDWGAAGN